MARSMGTSKTNIEQTRWGYWKIRRAPGASIGWGRKKTLHISSIYGFDTGQKDQQGQSYYERGNKSIRD
eukprot:15797809-Heterocapsa_arctica.AAC.1